MILRTWALGMLVAWPSLAAVSPEECRTLTDAHERFLESSFTVERHSRMSVNDGLKKREVARLTHSEGELETEIIEDEVLSKSMVFEGEGKDFALESKLACDRVESNGQGRYELESVDGLEVVVFELDVTRAALRPIAWKLDTTERFLFKKFVVEGRAEYLDFEWQSVP